MCGCEFGGSERFILGREVGEARLDRGEGTDRLGEVRGEHRAQQQLHRATEQHRQQDRVVGPLDAVLQEGGARSALIDGVGQLWVALEEEPHALDYLLLGSLGRADRHRQRLERRRVVPVVCRVARAAVRPHSRPLRVAAGR
eukprot:638985-Prymnesium_polylepis.1